jgi:hypothetical protein
MNFRQHARIISDERLRGQEFAGRQYRQLSAVTTANGLITVN